MYGRCYRYRKKQEYGGRYREIHGVFEDVWSKDCIEKNALMKVIVVVVVDMGVLYVVCMVGVINAKDLPVQAPSGFVRTSLIDRRCEPAQTETFVCCFNFLFLIIPDKT